MQKSILNRTVFCRDNIEVLRGMDSNSIDLIYLDPPFNKKRNFHAPIGSQAEGASFKDIWYEEDTKDEWIGLIADQLPVLHDYLQGIEKIGDASNKYYLVYMSIRLLELKRILKDTGSIYLHCDETMGHYLKLLMDCIFGDDFFRNEIIWHYSGWNKRLKHSFESRHDKIYFYGKSSKQQFNGYFHPLKSKEDYVRLRKQKLHTDDDGREFVYSDGGGGKRVKRYIDEVLATGIATDDLWEIDKLNNSSKENTKYPTQKPLALLERIIAASSNEGDRILDPFCGCATTLIAAEKLHRQWIGIDISPKAFDLVKLRLGREVGDSQDLLKRQNALIFREDIPERTDLVRSPATKTEVKHSLYGKQKGHCNGCDILFEYRHLTIDHILPRAKGGQDNPENLQLLCNSCNSIKSDNDMAYLRIKLREYGILR
ncbi:MAG: DNA methyltransferase [Candidatus Pacebacteria bacterium]|nr:DNA methyltransferase [Candidatus Paceibacterota bacterium]